MTQTLLGMSPQKYNAKIRHGKAVSIFVAVVTVALNLLFVLLRTDQNATIMLVANIVATIAGGWFLVAYVALVVQPMRRRYDLAMRPTQQISAQITHVESQTVRVSYFDCVKVHTNDHIYFLIDGTFCLTVGDTMQLLVASNIITGVTNEN